MKRNVIAILVDCCVAVNEREGIRMNTIAITTDSRNTFEPRTTLCF